MNRTLVNILGAVLAAAFAAIYIFTGYMQSFDPVVLVSAASSGTVIAEMDISYITLIKKNGSRIDGKIKIDRIDDLENGELRINAPAAVCEDGGKIYFVKSSVTSGNSSPVYEVSIADFGKKKLLPVFSMQQEEIENALGTDGDIEIYDVNFRVENGDVCAYVYAYEGRGLTDTMFRLCRSGSGFQAERLFSGMEGTAFLPVGGNVLWTNREGGLFMNEERLSDGVYRDLYALGENTAVCFDNAKKSYSVINAKDRTETPCTDIDSAMNAYDLKRQNVSGIFSENGEIWLAVNRSDDYSLINTASGARFEHLYADSTAVLILKCLGLAAAGFAAAWVIALAVYGIKVSGSSVLRFAAVCVPVFCVFCVTLYFGEFVFLLLEQTLRMVDDLEAAAMQCEAMGLVDEIEDFGYNEKYADKTVYACMTFDNFRSIGGADSDMSVTADYYGYSEIAGNFVNWEDLCWGIYDNPPEDNFPEKLLDDLKLCLADGKRRTESSYGSNCITVYMISPVKSPSGKITGFYLLSSVSVVAQYRGIELIMILLSYQIILCAAVITASIASAAAYLRGLRKLRAKAADFVDKGYFSEPETLKNKRRVSNEITIISDEFDELVADVNANNAEMMNFRVMNRAYFPDAVLKLLGRKNISAVTFTEKACENIYCLIAVLPGEYSGFKAMNGLLSALSGKLSEYNAFMTEVSGVALRIYSESPKSVNILFFLKEYDSRIKTAFDRCYLNVCGMRMGERRSFDVSFEDEERENIVVSTMLSTRAGSAVTERALLQNEYEFTKIPIGMADNEMIYEIMREHVPDAVCSYLRRGVQLYFNGDYKPSREMFIRVLKLQPKNQTARYYISLIDEI